jgi:hypothetical protein
MSDHRPEARGGRTTCVEGEREGAEGSDGACRVDELARESAPPLIMKAALQASMGVLMRSTSLPDEKELEMQP